MGFLRDAGAALTMGISATTKHKDAESAYQERMERHQRVIEHFNEVGIRASEAIDALDAESLSARDALISSGAFVVDEAGNIGYGWYQPIYAMGADHENGNIKQGAIGSLPAMATAVGAPVAVWTLAGALGTASTGVAISALSGAAAGAATAAWIGRAATLGIGGMTAGRLALGPIALASLPVQAVIGAKIAGNRERKAVSRYADAMREMDKRDEVLKRQLPVLQECRQGAQQIITAMVRHTGQLETTEVNTEVSQQAVSRLATDMQSAESVMRKFAASIDQTQSECGQ